MLVTELLACGHSVTVVDIMWFGNFLGEHENLQVIKEDVRNTDNLPLKGVDVVMHLANIANDPSCDLDAKLSWEVNALATMSMVERAIKHGVRQFIYASSGSVYGVKEEAQVTEDLSLVPISDYNKTKMISERVLLSYRDDIIVNCLRPASVCGYSPRMRLDLAVNMMTMQALTNQRLTVFGGNQTRPNIHILDLVAVYMHFMELGDKGPALCNAGYENISIMAIAKKVVEIVPAEIVVTESNDPRSYRLNSDRLLATGFQPKHSISDAMQEVIEAFRSGELKDEDNCYNIRTMKKLSF